MSGDLRPLRSLRNLCAVRFGSGRGAALAERVVAGDGSALAEQQRLLATLETASMCAWAAGFQDLIRSLMRFYADELPA